MTKYRNASKVLVTVAETERTFDDREAQDPVENVERCNDPTVGRCRSRIQTGRPGSRASPLNHYLALSPLIIH